MGVALRLANPIIGRREPPAGSAKQRLRWYGRGAAQRETHVLQQGNGFSVGEPTPTRFNIGADVGSSAVSDQTRYALTL